MGIDARGSLEGYTRYYAGKDLRLGHIFALDKPLGWTSYNVVSKVKWALHRRLGYKGLKVGHAGTLDPLATGLLLVCAGAATRVSGDLMAGDKEYEAVFHLGVTTPSFDLETEADGQYATSHIDEGLLRSVSAGFLGTQLQEPPLYSARRVGGTRAYRVARGGGSARLAPSLVEIKRFDIEEVCFPRVRARVVCSKGTYIRALARDFGLRLGSGAHLCGLRRTGSGSFRVADAMSVEEFTGWVEAVSGLARGGSVSNQEAEIGNG